MRLFDELQSLARMLVEIQEDLEDQHDRNVLGIAAHYLDKYAASLPDDDAPSGLASPVTDEVEAPYDANWIIRR